MCDQYYFLIFYVGILGIGILAMASSCPKDQNMDTLAIASKAFMIDRVSSIQNLGFWLYYGHG
jgi:hypothetical protein